MSVSEGLGELPFYNEDIDGQDVAARVVSLRIGTSMGQYGGAWGHDETRKSLGIAGAKVVEGITLSLPVKSLGGTHPRESAELMAVLGEALQKLVAELT